MKPCINEFAPLQSLRSGAAGADLSRRLEDGAHALRRAHPARRMASTLQPSRWRSCRSSPHLCRACLLLQRNLALYLAGDVIPHTRTGSTYPIPSCFVALLLRPSLSRTGAPLEVMSTHRFQSIVNCKGGKGPSTPACNPRATAHHCSARDAVAGPTPNATADKRDSAHIGREGGETRAVGCGRLSQGQTMRAEGRHVPHMSPFTVELILTAVHCLLIGRPRAPSSPTAREMPRGVAVASIARLPSSTDDPSGSTADRHEPVEDWGSTRGHVHT